MRQRPDPDTIFPVPNFTTVTSVKPTIKEVKKKERDENRLIPFSLKHLAVQRRYHAASDNTEISVADFFLRFGISEPVYSERECKSNCV